MKAERAAERRQREDAAPRLKEAVPHLDSLAIRFHEMFDDKTLAEGTHTRRVVVEHAPAHFEVPCANRECEGIHDVTQELLRALRSTRLEFSGRHVCAGCDKTRCGRVLCWVAVATYASN